MTRRPRRDSPKPSLRPPKDPKAANMRLKGKPPADTQISKSKSEDLQTGIIKNWNLPKPNINTCVAPEHWPSNESDPKKWHIDIVHLLHEASTIDLRKKGAIPCSNNEFFRKDLACEISLRQTKNKSRQGTVPWMTAADLKVIIKKLHYMAKDEEGSMVQKAKPENKAQEEDQKQNIRRGRSKANITTATQDKPEEGSKSASPQPEAAARSRRRPRIPSPPPSHPELKPSTKRQASDLPIRPARKPRNTKSAKTKNTAPPPITPSNPPEDSNDEEEDQENEPPEPISGRHIYGALIKPTTIDFNPEDSVPAPAQVKTRHMRKRGRVEDEKPPTEVQIDSDPRDIDATGFLSELDPKEARRRMKPRLSRLQQEPVAEPAWSQDVPVHVPETPLLTPATEEMVGGTPDAPAQGGGASPVLENGGYGEMTSLEIDVLMELLPGIPEHATPEEKSVLEDRIALIHRDIVAYKMSVWEINERGEK